MNPTEFGPALNRPATWSPDPVAAEEMYHRQLAECDAPAPRRRQPKIVEGAWNGDLNNT